MILFSAPVSGLRFHGLDKEEVQERKEMIRERQAELMEDSEAWREMKSVSEALEVCPFLWTPPPPPPPPPPPLVLFPPYLLLPPLFCAPPPPPRVPIP